MAQEGGLWPVDDVRLLSTDQFTEFLTKRFDSNWGPGFGKQLAELYKTEIAQDRQKAYDTMAADQGVLCGNQVKSVLTRDGMLVMLTCEYVGGVSHLFSAV